MKNGNKLDGIKLKRYYNIIRCQQYLNALIDLKISSVLLIDNKIESQENMDNIEIWLESILSFDCY
jgi:hypothetical protein